MNKKDEISGESGAATVENIALAGEHVLEIVRGGEENVLRVISPNGGAGLSITISTQGISVAVTGASVALRAAGKLSIDAEELSLHGRSGLTMTTGGDARIEAARDLSSEARIQNIHARLGNVNVRANDDVCLDGERVRLNSPSLRPLTPKREATSAIERPSPPPKEGKD